MAPAACRATCAGPGSEVVATKCATMKPISALKMTAVMAKMQDCCTTIQNVSRLKQEQEIAEADEPLHRLV